MGAVHSLLKPGGLALISVLAYQWLFGHHDVQLGHFRRWAIVLIVAFAAVITPSQDPYSLFAMALPMYLFYAGSIVIGKVMKR